tara:strand:- start:343 stop:1161 length:819 start_codon:yes stop_codon:yes gene_type:complete
MVQYAYDKPDSEHISKYLQNLKENSRVYLDIGCGHSFNMSAKMIDDSALTVLIDPKSSRLKLHQSISAKNVTVLSQYATPQNIEGIIKEHIGSEDITLLDLDIDSYDFELLQAILQVKKPYLIMAEINEKIPYPVEFYVCYDHSWDKNHFFGMSFASFCGLVQEDYDVMTLNQNNAFAIRKDMNNLGEHRTSQSSHSDLYESGYKNSRLKGRLPKFNYNSNVDHWLELEPEEAIEQIKQFFGHSEYAGANLPHGPYQDKYRIGINNFKGGLK